MDSDPKILRGTKSPRSHPLLTHDSKMNVTHPLANGKRHALEVEAVVEERQGLINRLDKIQ